MTPNAGSPVRRSLLFYTHAVMGGGAERVWALPASGLAARGHAVTLAYDLSSLRSLLPSISLAVGLSSGRFVPVRDGVPRAGAIFVRAAAR